MTKEAGFALLSLGTGVFPAWLAWITVGVAIVLLVAPIGWAALVFRVPDLGAGRLVPAVGPDGSRLEYCLI